MDLTNDMEIGVIIHKNIYVRLGIVLLLHLMKVSGEVVKRQLIPTFIPLTPRDQVVHTGDTVLLRCQIRNLGPKSVSWRKISEDFPLTIGDMMYAPNPEMSVDFVRSGRITNNTLIIKRVKPSHSGTYECQISSANIYTYHVTLEVLNTRRYTEPSITLDGTLYPSPNQKLNLTCNSTGNDRSPEKIDWFHNGNLIAENKPQWRNRAVIVNYVPEVPGVSLISQLTIDKVGASDAGIYVCRSMTPSEGMTVKTTSVMVNVLNAEKDIKKREDGHTQDTSHKLSRQDSNKTVRLSSCFYLILLGLLFQIVK
ncbi:roundabout homolog 2-like [Mytilus californianus]|uniref:roundabout homolog 2-like n=1 Tax=Mytilus californianus TaxID=6549 RepID=UPI0022453712|nr:roundabout homolog 2-like [Mytilus californianus]